MLVYKVIILFSVDVKLCLSYWVRGRYRVNVFENRVMREEETGGCKNVK
jgi:hypothetical protein